MSQIVKRKKKGRPSKADLARRASSSPADQEYELRRSLRRRNPRYNFDYDDYLDEEFEEDDPEEERRREKKLEHVLKLNQSRASADPPSRGRGRPAAARGRHASDAEGREEEGGEVGEEDAAEQEEEEDDDGERKPVKKRKIYGEEDNDYDEEDQVDEDDDDDDEEKRRRKEAEKRSNSGPGTPGDPPSGTPMPDKKSLELILDKLQKKDIYGVYAEPVDPKELPDYHDIIEHPMDFATVRKKLANGSYSTLEEFEGDVFLICSNAMQYNTSDTVYYKQARTIQEMARKKIEKIRIKIERAEKELKSEQKMKPSFPAKKQMKQLQTRSVLEPVGSDFSAGANLATGGSIQNGSVATQAVGLEKHNHTDALLEGNISFVDNLEKTEELSSGKSLLGKFGRKLSAVDENLRATYNISIQPPDRSESVFTTFEGEIKQLVAVGLHAEHAYARSLTRFAATLGPIAWKVASQRIEQALPAGFKFGRGWVGEYEPLPTPVLLLETHTHKASSPFTKSLCSTDRRNGKIPFKNPVPTKEKPASEAVSDGKSILFRTPPFVASPGTKPNSVNLQKNPFSRAFVEHQNKIAQQVELNLPPSTEQNNSVLVSEKQGLDKAETVASKSSDTVTRNINLVQSPHLKPVASNGASPATFPNGNVTSGSNSRVIGMSTDTPRNHMARASTYSTSHGHDQGLSDPVQLMRNLTEKAKLQQSPSNQRQVHSPSIVSSVASRRTDDSSNAAVAASRAWMSIGSGGFKQTTESSSIPKNQISAESLYNPARELHPTQVLKDRGSEFPIPSGMQFQPERNSFPFQGFVSQPFLNGAQVQNMAMVFPQFVASDLSRFQVQPQWRGITPHVQLKHKQNNFPPDLNIGVQSPDSPAKQSSGVRVDSQQPDLALQL